MAEQYALPWRTKTSILDLPDEVLSQIILLLTARERIPLGESCQRLNILVFEDRQLLKYLDFSTKAHLTRMTHIQPYFENENTYQRILRINARNVKCLKPGRLLNNSIGKAINLVEVNIHGVRFKDIWELGSFLQQLIHLGKLSIDWPETVENDDSICRLILQRPWGKLTYLSVDLTNRDSAMFTNSLSLCQQLKKILIKANFSFHDGFESNFSNSAIKQLTNLKIVQFHGKKASRIKEELVTVLPDPETWTDFQLCEPIIPEGFYIEKDVEVCEELLRSERLHDFLNPAPWVNFNLGWAVNPGYLVQEVLRITHEDVPDDLCCLSKFVEGDLQLLKVEHAKMLLKDPRCQISSLYFNHELERGCDAHLLASAFTNLTELVLFTITRSLRERIALFLTDSRLLPFASQLDQTPPKDSHCRGCCRMQCSPVPEGQDDSVHLDSSFKMLVENTPNLRHFKLNPNMMSCSDWDFDALHLICAWKSLETLDIRHIPIEDGQFLIEIGKQCKNLQRLFLCHLPYDKPCRYEDALFTMLKHCRKLRIFNIHQSHVDQVEMFESLAKNVDLEQVSAGNKGREHSISDWIQSLENLIRQCKKLTIVRLAFTVKSEDDYKEADSAVRRLKTEFRRRDLQIEGMCWGIPGVCRIGAEVYDDDAEPKFLYLY